MKRNVSAKPAPSSPGVEELESVYESSLDLSAGSDRTAVLEPSVVGRVSMPGKLECAAKLIAYMRRQILASDVGTRLLRDYENAE